MIRLRSDSSPEAGPARGIRVLVAWALTIWTVLQVLALVVVAVRGGGPELAFAFFVAGVLTLVLGAATWRAWAWVARSPEGGGRVIPQIPTVGTARVAGDYEPDAEGRTEPSRHRGLSGEITPPRRW